MVFKNSYNIIKLFDQKSRKFILIAIDTFLILSSIYTSFWFINPILIERNSFFLLSFLHLIISLNIYFLTGQYKGITRFIGSALLYKFIFRNIFITLISLLIYKLFSNETLSIKFWMLLLIFQTILTSSIRFLFRDLLSKDKLIRIKKNTINLLIYGAGSAGASLASYISKDNRYKIIGFIDDCPKLWGREVNGVEIYSEKEIQNLIIKKEVTKIFFAIPSLESTKYKKLLMNLQKYNIEVLRVPSFNEISQGKKRVDNLRSIEIEDLLMRREVKPKINLLSGGISSKNILVSGAGGTIGSELCRQILKLNPKSLILIEQNEPSLYLISEELKNIKNDGVKVKSILGNACELKLVEKIFSENKIEIIFHAAAHKHVPMVEMNRVEGLKNNILSTLNLAKSSLKFNSEKFILVSSDKAVRPTSVMGASKRVSELILKKLSLDISNQYQLNSRSKTSFSIVRFGNVLNSSGSVIPLFKKQLKNGGPLTITHPEITRYFMTISEAIELVLQSAALAEGGEIFLLDMGEAVKILDLAKQLISLSGYKLKDTKNPNGDIEIIFNGLRPGEKLYEELLIDSKAEETIHPLIYKSKENDKLPVNFSKNIDSLLKELNNHNEKESLNLLSQIVKEWSPADTIKN